MIYRTFLALAILVSVSVATPVEQPRGDCVECVAYGQKRVPNRIFTYREGCKEFICGCSCNGSWSCPPERVEYICTPDDDSLVGAATDVRPVTTIKNTAVVRPTIASQQERCYQCWAGHELRQPNQLFTFTENCYKYNCFCQCDGGWKCPAEKTIDICNTNLTTGCYYCDVAGVRNQGNSLFKFVKGCIEYECMCNCNGSWNCPGDRAKDRCNTHPQTGCYYCNVAGSKYDGNSHFQFVNGCIEYNCVCNCDGSWNCPGEQARDLCRQNLTTGCYYCEVEGYLYQGNSQFDLMQDCYIFRECICECDGGWTCKHTRGVYNCNQYGIENKKYKSCTIDGKEFRGNSRFYYERSCIKYTCTCDKYGRYYCAGSDAFVTCAGVKMDYIASLTGAWAYDAAEHSRANRQVQICKQCMVDRITYNEGETFTQQQGCNLFFCTCLCNGNYTCPQEKTQNICSGSRANIQDSAWKTRINGSSSLVSDSRRGSEISTCRDCRYLGVTYKANSPATYESGCWRYYCQCYCNGTFKCPSDKSTYICKGTQECIKCDAGDGKMINPNTDFELQIGCIRYDKCRCNCDGGWTCADGIFTCDLCQGCKVDENIFPGNRTFQLKRGCDLFEDCFCECNGKWNCVGQKIKDQCGQCRKCRIGDAFYEGNTSFSAVTVKCTQYRQCKCECDGRYECTGGSYICGERDNQLPGGVCSNCVEAGRTYTQGSSYDFKDGCYQYRGCACKCGNSICRQVTDSCGDCRTCTIDGIDYAGGTKFDYSSGCLSYRDCECGCDGKWKCLGEKATDKCNVCRKCSVDGTLYNQYSKFSLDRDCWKYQCFCLCNGTTWCPSSTAVNTCNKPSVCRRCDVASRQYSGNSHFTYTFNGMNFNCRCNCDGSYICIVEWLYIKEDVSISGESIGSVGSSCFSCNIEGRTYRGSSRFTITRNEVDLNCECFCNGGYYCSGEYKFEIPCRSCSMYGKNYEGGTGFPIIYNGFRLNCQCSCNGNYTCYGAAGDTVIYCLGGNNCLPATCERCVIDNAVFRGGDTFGMVYNGQNLRCDCGCDGSHYCEGSGGLILSCLGGRCTEIGCGSCNVFGYTHESDSRFNIIYRGVKLSCQCSCGGSYICIGSKSETVVTCSGSSDECLPLKCIGCFANGRQYAGKSMFMFDYNGIAMECTCACDGSYYCNGISELIEISCIGGTCTRIGCGSCNVFGLVIDGDKTFNLVHSGQMLQCQCFCDSGYRCVGSSNKEIVTCVNGVGCLPPTCRPCIVNNREYAGRSEFRTQYKGIDVKCICGCDGTSYCTGLTVSIDVSCSATSCNRIGCRECNILGKEYLGGASVDIIFRGARVSCQCECDGGYVCKDKGGITVVTCVNGVGSGCLFESCRTCLVNGQQYEGETKFRWQYRGIEMDCTCSCDSSYFCQNLLELFEISCIGGTCTSGNCKKCNLYGKEFESPSNFNIVHSGFQLQCKCDCDGSYRCLGKSGAIVIQCRDNKGNCLAAPCRSCLLEGSEYAGGTSFRYRYKGIDVTCNCGCDGSMYCIDATTKIIISCIGSKCSPIGCTGCRAFGKEYEALSSFNIIYSGQRLNCQCECTGGYACRGTGEPTVICRDNRGCLPESCSACTLDGKNYQGASIFKYAYKGIDMSCTCGCDSSIFCVGVTEIIEISCIGGTCSPLNCRSCSIFSREYESLSSFSIIYQGLKINCSCACDTSYICYDSSGSSVINCISGEGKCLPRTCKECVIGVERYPAFSTFSHRYKAIDMLCTCGCDGTAFCEGKEEVIFISCVGETCAPLDCRSCNIFGQQYVGDSSFGIIYKGVEVRCNCNCDTSYRCIGSAPGSVALDCPVGRSCVPNVCRKCRVKGNSYNGNALFDYTHEGIAMSCTCGCDGSYFCRGKSTNIEISCPRLGECTRVGGCMSCNIFGHAYESGSVTNLVYHGRLVKCECRCDSSYTCRGTANEIIIECAAGQICLNERCGMCTINGRNYTGNTDFDIVYFGKDMHCTCGCDGSYYCKCKEDDSEISCNRSSCTWLGCVLCISDGRQRQIYEEFEKTYNNIKMNCLCSCDGSYRCQGVGRKITISCKGDNCNVIGCRTCLIEGQEYQAEQTYEINKGSRRERCRCNCDGQSSCEVIERPTCTNCIIDGTTYSGHSRNRVYRGAQSFVCDCYCDGRHECTPEEQLCSQCTIGGTKYNGNTQFETVLEGTVVQCNCECNGKFVCKGASKTCTGSGCTEDCRECVIEGHPHKGNTTFQAVVQGITMSCSCDCSGRYGCTSEFWRCSTGSGCIENCIDCIIDGKPYVKSANFQAVIQDARMQCSCDCAGNYICKNNFRTCTSISGCVENCKGCLIDGERYATNSSFAAFIQGDQMQCSCDCTGVYACRNEYRACSSSFGCVDICRNCSIDRRTYSGNSNFSAMIQGSLMKCICDCAGGYVCESDYRTCSSQFGCVDKCRECIIDGRRFGKNVNFRANAYGAYMQCSCDCTGSFVCKNDLKTCTASGCVNNCRNCTIEGKRYAGNSNFTALVQRANMQCSCDCNGGYVCRNEFRTCSSASGCINICKECSIEGKRYSGNSNFSALVQGLAMKCICDCAGGYICESDYRTCSSQFGCVDKCRECIIDGRRFGKNVNFRANAYGAYMQCSCDCTGSFVCKNDLKTCTASGCVDNCRNCTIEGQKYSSNTNFSAIVHGSDMKCTCSCDGSYSCRSDVRICSQSGCVDNCRDCMIDGRRYTKSSNFPVTYEGVYMQCSCDCSGSYVCQSDTRTCTSLSGCVDKCRGCIIDGQQFPGNSNFEAQIMRIQMQCACDCTGNYICKNDYKTCTSTGCVNTGRCRECVFQGQTYAGNSRFETIMQNVRMQCTCDCNGVYECRGGTFICSTQSGCINSCAGCEIEGNRYEGNTQFEIFHNAYGMQMTCNCTCTGSYKCTGTKTINSCVGPGCTSNQCNECTISGRKYPGNTQFQLIIDSIPMDCSCYCNGDHQCVGRKTESSCVGPGCGQEGCGQCVINGITYAGNSRFEIVDQEGITLQCTCACDGKYSCKGEKNTAVCVGSNCPDSETGRCLSCNVDGKVYRSNSQFQMVNDGIELECTCGCKGEYNCQGSKLVPEPCVGPNCGARGCKRCVIDGQPYSGNTRFTFRKGNLDYTCVCYCDGSYSCRGSTGFETSCVGESCAADQCRSCTLDNKEYQLDSRFRLLKNDLVMNCVCECDGAYRCFSVSGICHGNECDDYGCKSCTIDGQSYNHNAEFELPNGLICTCECSGQYKCRTKSLHVECVGSECGVGGCKQCQVDGETITGNSRFQIRKYGLLMQCACNCDSSYKCRGYQIISSGETQGEYNCKSCEINGNKYDGGTQFQVIINGVRSVCSCDCNGEYSCQEASPSEQCRHCVIGDQRYLSNSNFTLTRNGNNINCRCDCDGNFICEGRKEGVCVGRDCLLDGCKDCAIFGVRYKGDTSFTTDVGGVRMLCECLCSGEYNCKGYRSVTNIILPAVEEENCKHCLVSGQKHPGNSRFRMQRSCFSIECICKCDGIFECPAQVPQYICSVSDTPQVQQFRYAISGTHVYTTGNAQTEFTQSKLIYTGVETPSSSIGNPSCQSCLINGKEYAGNTEFILQDSCLRWTCACDCNGGWNCSSVVGSDCEGPLNSFDGSTIVAGSKGRPAENSRTVIAIRPSGYGSESVFTDLGGSTYTSYTTGEDSSSHRETDQAGGIGGVVQSSANDTYSDISRLGSGTLHERGAGGTNSSSSSSSNSNSSFEGLYRTGTEKNVYRISANTGNITSGGSSSEFGTAFVNSSLTSNGTLNLRSLLSGGNLRCMDCVVNGESVKGGRDFTFRSGCIEYLCECNCNGKHFCDPSKSVNFCTEDQTRLESRSSAKGCSIGDRTYTTKLFSFTRDCLKYTCQCFDNGSYNCDASKTKRVC